MPPIVRGLSARKATDASNGSDVPKVRKGRWELGAEQLEWVKDAFARNDLDNDGSLSLEELRGLWGMMFPYRTEEEIVLETERIFQDIDADHDGCVRFDELFSYLKEDEDEENFLPAPKKTRQWIWAIVGEYQGTYDMAWLTNTARCFTILSQCAILASIVNMMVESLPEFQNREGEPGNSATRVLEETCLYVFTAEFVLRTISYPGTKVRYMTQSSTWIDLLSILPFWLTEFGLFGGENGSQSLMALRLFRTARPILRALRYIRVLRVLKLGRKSAGVQLMLTSIKRARSSLWWLCLFTLMAMTMSSSLLYYAEKEDAEFRYEEQAWYREDNSSLPDAGQKVFFQSIPDSMWWALVTLTTTGYGDTYPVTIGGKVVAGLTMIAGLLVVGYPITILTAVFQDVHQEYLDDQARSRRREILKDKLLKSELFNKGEGEEGGGKEELPSEASEALEEFAKLNLGLVSTDTVSEGDNNDSPKSPANLQIPTLVLPKKSSSRIPSSRGMRTPSFTIRRTSAAAVTSSTLCVPDEEPTIPLSHVNELISNMEATILTHLSTFDKAIATIREDLDMIIEHVGLDAPPSPPKAPKPPLPPLPPPKPPKNKFLTVDNVE